MNASGIVLAIGSLLFFAGLFISFSILDSGFVPGQSDGPETLSQIESQIIQKLSKEHQAGNICSASQEDVQTITDILQKSNQALGRPFPVQLDDREVGVEITRSEEQILDDSLLSRMDKLEKQISDLGVKVDPELVAFRETLVSTQTFEEKVAETNKILQYRIEDQMVRMDRIDSALGQFLQSWDQETVVLTKALRDLKDLQSCSLDKLKAQLELTKEPVRWVANEYLPIPQRQDAVKQAMIHAWDSYRTTCWGNDELKPLSLLCESWSSPPLGLTILDALDTLWIMGLDTRFKEARDWVATSLNLDSMTSISVFETTIRALGGLLSAYDLSEDPIFLEKAKILGVRLFRAFDKTPFSPVVAPATHVVLGIEPIPRGRAFPSTTNLAEAGTLQLEFLRLALLLGDQELAARVMVIWEKIIETKPALPGLFPLYLDTTGRSAGGRITLGGMGDSFYEYLMKIGLFTGNKVKKYRQVYDETVSSVLQHMVYKTQPRNYTYIAELNGPGQPATHVMEHLTCFAGGMFALGAQGNTSARDLRLGAEVTATCREFYAQMPTGIGAEVMMLNPQGSTATGSTAQLGVGGAGSSPQPPQPPQPPPVLGADGRPLTKDFAPVPRSAHYILRPETLESIFIMFRLTGDSKYQDWAWDIFQAIQTHCRGPVGYSGIRGVDQLPAQKDDLQQSFFLAETLKYLYLIFSDNTVIPLDKYVFNTEAHPFKIQTNLSPDWIDVIENPSKFLEGVHKRNQEEQERLERERQAEELRLAEERRRAEEEARRIEEQRAFDEMKRVEDERKAEEQRIENERRQQELVEQQRLLEIERQRQTELEQARRRESELEQERNKQIQNQLLESEINRGDLPAQGERFERNEQQMMEVERAAAEQRRIEEERRLANNNQPLPSPSPSPFPLDSPLDSQQPAQPFQQHIEQPQPFEQPPPVEISPMDQIPR